MKITKRQLRRIIREEKQKLLAENRVRKTVRKLLKEASLGVDALAEYDAYITIKQSAMNPGKPAYEVYISDENGNQLEGRVRGDIFLRPPHDGEYGSGPCGGAFEAVYMSAAKGWGSLVYDVAIELATQVGGGLMPDRLSMPAAEVAIWDNYYSSRGDVQSHQLDLRDMDIQAAKRKGIRLQKLNPDRPEDECRQKKAFRSAGPENWDQSPLSKRFTKPPTMMNALRAAGRLIER